MEEADDIGERAAQDGPVSAKTTYKDWFETLDNAEKEEILGKGRFRMYQEGASISRFTEDGRILTLDQLKEKEGL
jgi:hypothetical protein